MEYLVRCKKIVTHKKTHMQQIKNSTENAVRKNHGSAAPWFLKNKSVVERRKT